MKAEFFVFWSLSCWATKIPICPKIIILNVHHDAILLISLSVRPSRFWKSRSCSSVQVLKLRSGPVCPYMYRSCPFPRNNCRRQCCLKSTVTAVRSQLIATTGARCGVCLDFCFTLILCFLFAPSFTAVEISSSVLESTAACASLIKNLEIGHQAGLSGDDNNNRNYNA